MKTYKIVYLIVFTVTCLTNNLYAQEERGYYDAPYTRYEADQGILSNASIGMMSFSQKDLQSEQFTKQFTKRTIYKTKQKQNEQFTK